MPPSTTDSFPDIPASSAGCKCQRTPGRLITAPQRYAIIYITAYNAETREDGTLLLIRWACKQAPLNAELVLTGSDQQLRHGVKMKNKFKIYSSRLRSVVFPEISMCSNLRTLLFTRNNPSSFSSKTHFASQYLTFGTMRRCWTMSV